MPSTLLLVVGTSLVVAISSVVVVGMGVVRTVVVVGVVVETVVVVGVVVETVVVVGGVVESVESVVHPQVVVLGKMVEGLAVGLEQQPKIFSLRRWTFWLIS